MQRSLGPMTREAVVARARGAVGAGTHYELGAGGRDPRTTRPGPKCDCSGFAAWCLGVDRYLPNAGVPHLPDGEWLETTALFRDARSPFGFVTDVAWTAAQPGDLLVWPDAGKRQGHVGVVSAAKPGVGPRLVVHCAVSNERRTGDAVAETGSELFERAGAIAVRVAWVG